MIILIIMIDDGDLSRESWGKNKDALLISAGSNHYWVAYSH